MTDDVVTLSVPPMVDAAYVAATSRPPGDPGAAAPAAVRGQPSLRPIVERMLDRGLLTVVSAKPPRLRDGRGAAWRPMPRPRKARS